MKIMLGKACPFCGRKEQTITCEEAYENSGSGCVCISCNCGCDLYMFGKAETPYAEAIRKAVEKWDARITP